MIRKHLQNLSMGAEQSNSAGSTQLSKSGLADSLSDLFGDDVDLDLDESTGLEQRIRPVKAATVDAGISPLERSDGDGLGNSSFLLESFSETGGNLKKTAAICVTQQDVTVYLMELIGQVSSLLEVPHIWSSLLLQYYKWDKRRLEDGFFDHYQEACAGAGLPSHISLDPRVREQLNRRFLRFFKQPRQPGPKKKLELAKPDASDSLALVGSTTGTHQQTAQGKQQQQQQQQKNNQRSQGADATNSKKRAATSPAAGKTAGARGLSAKPRGNVNFRVPRIPVPTLSHQPDGSQIVVAPDPVSTTAAAAVGAGVPAGPGRNDHHQQEPAPLSPGRLFRAYNPAWTALEASSAPSQQPQQRSATTGTAATAASVPPPVPPPPPQTEPVSVLRISYIPGGETSSSLTSSRLSSSSSTSSSSSVAFGLYHLGQDGQSQVPPRLPPDSTDEFADLDDDELMLQAALAASLAENNDGDAPGLSIDPLIQRAVQVAEQWERQSIGGGRDLGGLALPPPPPPPPPEQRGPQTNGEQSLMQSLMPRSGWNSYNVPSTDSELGPPFSAGYSNDNAVASDDDEGSVVRLMQADTDYFGSQSVPAFPSMRVIRAATPPPPSSTSSTSSTDINRIDRRSSGGTVAVPVERRRSTHTAVSATVGSRSAYFKSPAHIRSPARPAPVPQQRRAPASATGSAGHSLHLHQYQSVQLVSAAAAAADEYLANGEAAARRALSQLPPVVLPPTATVEAALPVSKHARTVAAVDVAADPFTKAARNALAVDTTRPPPLLSSSPFVPSSRHRGHRKSHNRPHRKSERDQEPIKARRNKNGKASHSPTPVPKGKKKKTSRSSVKPKRKTKSSLPLDQRNENVISNGGGDGGHVNDDDVAVSKVDLSTSKQRDDNAVVVAADSRNDDGGPELAATAPAADCNELLVSDGHDVDNDAVDGDEDGDEIECEICYCDYKKREMMALHGCEHMFCYECWAGHLRAKLDAGIRGVESATCMNSGCELRIDFVSWCTALDRADKASASTSKNASSLSVPESNNDNSSDSLLSRFKFLFIKAFIDATPNAVWCPNPFSCIYAIYMPFGPPEEGVQCQCGWEFCASCLQYPHAPASCEQVKKWKDITEDKGDDLRWITQNTKACPGCGIPIEKNEGCMHMNCTSCGASFCWLCKKEWEGNHSEYYSCSRYNNYDADTVANMKKQDENLIASHWGAFAHALQRFKYQEEAENLGKQSASVIKEQAEELAADGGFSGVQLAQALEIVLACRATLKYSYVHSYFSYGSPLDGDGQSGGADGSSSSSGKEKAKQHQHQHEDRVQLSLDREFLDFLQSHLECNVDKLFTQLKSVVTNYRSTKAQASTTTMPSSGGPGRTPVSSSTTSSIMMPLGGPNKPSSPLPSSSDSVVQQLHQLTMVCQSQRLKLLDALSSGVMEDFRILDHHHHQQQLKTAKKKSKLKKITKKNSNK